jgi:ubiquinone/menaquinone biosynthesis C-methylase UbiE
VADGTVPESIWDSDETAAGYAAFAGEFTMYRDTSRDLVELARPAPGAVVVDLACGTGVTTREILAVLGHDGRVTGIDQSAAMLAVAGRSVTDPRVSWVRASAEEFDQAVPGPADAVICNSAIWQTDFASTARAAHAVLAPGGVLAFNIGAEFVCDAANTTDPAQYPLITMMRQIAADQYGWSLPAQPGTRRPRLSEHQVSQLLDAAGFTIRHAGWLHYEQTPESQLAWLRIPSFTDRHLPGLSYQARMAVLDEAVQRLGTPRTHMTHWFAVGATAN